MVRSRSFFVLSGFLVSGLLFIEFQATKKIRPFHFLARRGFKIYPLFYFTVCVYLVYHFLKHTVPAMPSILAEIFFYQNYYPGVITIAWSLAVEEHFYILLALVLFFLSKTTDIGKSMAVPYGCLMLGILCLSARIMTNLYGEHSMMKQVFPTHLRIDSLAFGVFISWFFHFRYDRLKNFVEGNKNWLIFLSPLLITPAFIWTIDNSFILTVGFTLLYIGFGILMILLVFYENRLMAHPAFSNGTSFFRILAWIGKSSYAIYLVHILIGPGIAHRINLQLFNEHLSPAMLFMLSSSASIAVGFFLTRLIEWPALKLRNILIPGVGNALERKKLQGGQGSTLVRAID